MTKKKSESMSWKNSKFAVRCYKEKNITVITLLLRKIVCVAELIDAKLARFRHRDRGTAAQVV